MSDNHLRVYGHPRSGNHFLAAMLHRHFYDDSEDFALHVDPHATGHWSRRSDRSRAPGADFVYEGHDTPGVVGTTLVPYGKLLGHHKLPPRFHHGGPIYIFRDGRDVALSVYDWTRFRPAALEELAFEKYIQRPIDWEGSPGHRARPRETLFAHWKRHVSTWLAADVFPVRYESLVQDPMRELVRIGEHFGLKVLPGVERMGPVGWNASSATPEQVEKRLAKWRTKMSPRVVAVYDALVPKDFVGRWDP